MNEPDDLALLREYAAQNSESAFAELVSRRVDFVYSAALRQVRNPDLAEEITQAVFILLAQKAGQISDKTILTGWLFKTTRFTTLAQIRAETKRARQQKEFQMQSQIDSGTGFQPVNETNEFWNKLSPLLDEALAALGETDRQAVLLRFFENKSLAEVGEFLGIGEDTARKRVSRALEKLHRYFNRRGVSSTTAILAGAISTHSIQAAPMGLAKTISIAAVAKGAAASISTLTLIKGALKLMAWTKTKIAIGTGAVVLLATGVTATYVWESMPTSSIAGMTFTAPTRIWTVPNTNSSSSSSNIVPLLGGDNSKSNRIIFKTDVNTAAEELQRFKTQSVLATNFPDGQLPVLILTLTHSNAPVLKPASLTEAGSLNCQNGHCIGVNEPLSALIPFLENYFSTNISDATGNEHYDFDLQWDEPNLNQHNVDGLKTALRKQIGVELFPGKTKFKLLIRKPAIQQ